MKQKRFLRVILVLTVIAVLTTSVYAYMVHKSKTIANVFKPAEVTCEISETFNGSTKSSVKVKNTGNVDAYIRIRLVIHWEDSKGNAVAWDIDTIPSYAKPNQEDISPVIDYNENAWIRDLADGYTYYCKTPVSPDGSTPEFLDEGVVINLTPRCIEEKISETESVEYWYYPVIEILAEAIQSLPETAVKGAWGVNVVDGKIQ